jgi:hypothetical protein
MEIMAKWRNLAYGVGSHPLITVHRVVLSLTESGASLSTQVRRRPGLRAARAPVLISVFSGQIALPIGENPAVFRVGFNGKVDFAQGGL